MKKTLSLVTRQDDPQWSSIVFWIAMATFYAEEEGLTHDLSYKMPEFHLVGSYEGGDSGAADRDFTRLLRDAVIMGNYGELYERNVAKIIPRGGRNKLNQYPFGPQLNPSLLFL